MNYSLFNFKSSQQFFLFHERPKNPVSLESRPPPCGLYFARVSSRDGYET